MDKNSTLGMLLIGGIIMAYLTYISPSEEELARAQVIQDSIEQIETKKIKSSEVSAPETHVQSTIVDTLKTDSVSITELGFNTKQNAQNQYVTIENELIRVTLSSLGGQVSSVELKNYQTYDSLPLILFDEAHSEFGLKFFTGNQRITTSELQFQAEGESFVVANDDSKSISMRYYASPSEYVEYEYTLSGNSYEVGTTINLVGINNLVASNIVDMDLDWTVTALPLEKNIKDERSKYTTIYYKYAGDEVDYISEGSDDDIKADAKIKWIAYKQQFFSSILTAETAFHKPISMSTVALEDSAHVLKTMSSTLAIPFEHSPTESFPMSFYFGPVDYDILNDMDDEYE
ncbi:MAG: membrane protein insertase YidC, partial [Flavobacteriales bacterium]|nr:membrane protein insertase YidC [Flavobacteriales bacterium]